MSKSITEKELAEKLAGIYGDINDYDWPTVARAAAELLGAELAPEMPEPGTIGVTCDGLAAYVDGGCVWRVILANGDWRNANDADTISPARVISEESYEAWQDNLRRTQDERDSWENEYEKAVARVVPAEPVELSDGALVREWNEAMDEEADTDVRWERVAAWAFMGKGDQAVLRRFAHNLLAKHGTGRQVTRADVMDAYTGGTMKVSSLDTRAIDRIMELLEAAK